MLNRVSFVMMIKLQNTSILIVCLLLAIVSCKDSGSEEKADNNSPRIVRNTKLLSPSRNATFSIGDTVSFEVQITEGKLDSIQLEFAGKTTTHLSNKLDWIPQNSKTGKQKVKLKTFFSGQNETHYLNITFLSDVVPEAYTYKVINTYSHNTKAYTQGLFFKEDTLVESTGQRGKSWIAKLDLETSKVYKKLEMDDKYFGEGTCYWNNQYIHLTYTSQVGFTYDNNFNQLKTFNYTYQGWGATTWGDTLYVSDGTHTIHRLDPRDFSEIGQLEVYNHEGKIMNVNEMEVIDGLIYANIYQEDYIVAIDPLTGRVLKTIDMAGLLTPLEARRTDVLNGIAYHSGRKSTYVTGKLWPKIFEVEFLAK
ncbi:MAG: glutaminyl-peptide cyclotransferase [Cyclobacteriaceae bacterium]